VTVLWNKGVHTAREDAANMPDTLETKERENTKIYTSRCGNTSGQECHAKGGRGG